METIEARVARLEERDAGVREDVADIKADMKTQNAMLATLVADRNQRKGASVVTKALVGVVSSGGILGWLYEHFSK